MHLYPKEGVEYILTSGWIVLQPRTTGFQFPGPQVKDLSFSSPLDDTTYFRRIVTDPSVTEPDISFRIAVYVHQAITNNTISAPDTVCQGNKPKAFVSVGLPAKGDNVNYDYLWQKDEGSGIYLPASGTNDQPGYAPPELNVTTIFRRVVTSGACVDNSLPLTVTVFAPISGNLIADYDTICFNTAPELITQDPEITLGGGDPNPANWRYRWESGPAISGPWVEMPGATNAQYQPGILTATTWYRREVLSGNDNACVDTSDPVEILNVPVITGNEIVTADQTVCTDDLPQLMQGTTPGGGRNKPGLLLMGIPLRNNTMGGGRQYQREQSAKLHAPRNDRRYDHIQKGSDVGRTGGSL